MKNKWKKDYNYPCIYRISCRDPEIKDCYIGSTTNLQERMKWHRRCANGYYYGVLYSDSFISKNGGWDNWIVHIMEWLPNCESKEDLEDIEMFYIMNNPNTTLNKLKHKQYNNTYIPNNEPEEYVVRNDYYNKIRLATRRNQIMYI